MNIMLPVYSQVYHGIMVMVLVATSNVLNFRRSPKFQ